MRCDYAGIVQHGAVVAQKGVEMDQGEQLDIRGSGNPPRVATGGVTID